jgi:hypothetical protein
MATTTRKSKAAPKKPARKSAKRTPAKKAGSSHA